MNRQEIHKPAKRLNNEEEKEYIAEQRKNDTILGDTREEIFHNGDMLAAESLLLLSTTRPLETGSKKMDSSVQVIKN